ncbi:MAG TPA: phosphohistidine phosphatase SixA [Bryobacteraceae bacterium]|nr:phosphohistidine phosphatase SixA [Bryobacteraceae bacterium]
MEVYLLRHGIADDDSPTGRDQDRQLTAEGRRKLAEVVKTAAAAGVKPDVIVSSPYARALQTADIAKEILAFKDDIQRSQALVPESDPEEVWSEIRNAYRGAHSLLISSHEPLMGRCTGFLLGYTDLLIDFQKGAIVRIDIESFGIQPRGLLKWMLVPKLVAS